MEKCRDDGYSGITCVNAAERKTYEYARAREQIGFPKCPVACAWRRTGKEGTLFAFRTTHRGGDDNSCWWQGERGRRRSAATSTKS